MSAQRSRICSSMRESRSCWTPRFAASKDIPATRVRVYVNDSRGDRAIEGTDLLVATGRKANSDGIGLDKTGVQLDERGYIKTNERLETTAESIWAMGDCAGSPQFTHVGLDDYNIVHANLKRRQSHQPQSPDSLLHVHRPGTGARR